jgi:hypothetical protein
MMVFDGLVIESLTERTPPTMPSVRGLGENRSGDPEP